MYSALACTVLVYFVARTCISADNLKCKIAFTICTHHMFGVETLLWICDHIAQDNRTLMANALDTDEEHKRLEAEGVSFRVLFVWFQQNTN